MNTSQEALLIQSCEKEPVQFIGAVQEFGALVLADPASGKVTQVSANVGDFLGQAPADLIGKPLRNIFGKIPSPGAVYTRFGHDKIEVCSYLRDGRWYIELEHAPESDASRLSQQVRDAMDTIAAGSSWQEYLHETAKHAAAILDYDRVMIYRFHEDLHGEVVAEAVKLGVDSFLGLHYPASDIPAISRQVFLDNWVRMIPTIAYQPMPLEPALCPITGQSPSLGHTAIRAVSPVHLEYLRNMRVAASLTVSIKTDGALWGLIACHNLTPRQLDREERAAAELLGRFVSATLKDAAKIEEVAERRRLAKVENIILNRLKGTDDLGHEMLQVQPTILDMIQADGSAAALYVNGAWETLGEAPGEADLDQLADWLHANHGNRDIYATDRLPEEYPDAAAFQGIASGVLAINIPKSARSYVFFFRPEQIRSVRWAGNPDEKIPDATGRLHPRASFREWKDSVRGRSSPWQSWELDSARKLREAILGADLQKQYEREQDARRAAERAMQSREELMAVLSHDLKNPIGSITLQAALMERVFVKNQDDKSLELVKRIQRATQNMNGLINDILHVTSLEAGQLHMERQPEEIRNICGEVLDMLSPLAQNGRLTLRLAADSVTCPVDVDRERIFQVLSNLVGNAIKFTPAGGTIEVRVEKCGPEEAVIAVSDTGPGIPAEHHLFIFDRFWQANQAKRLGSGLGLAISKGIVEAHGGKIWVENGTPTGTIFHFTLPLAPVR